MRHLISAIAAISTLLALGACNAETGSPTAASPTNAVASAAPSTASATAEPTPSVATRTVTETRKIPYKTRRVNDPTLAKGRTKVKRRGVPGVRTLTYEVTSTDGEETDKRLLREAVTKKPVTRIIAIGTEQARRCDPNYSGACVPITSDVDCAGGSGDGPGYVRGPVRVVGSDIYDLDRDGDGTACDT
ncbi:MULTISPECIES: G5 domain-containing protein [unclassified Spirillospora]|uniref:G5 domain-containing protein n=1 Tax=unclassified Spirillospora TaxID=2642701 RepID=UPI003713DFA0